MIKLNIGCGFDYRNRFINIDASSSLPKVDMVLDINTKSLSDAFDKESVDYILAQDIIEHFFHWQAVKILEDCYSILKSGGYIEIRVPNVEYIIKSSIPIDRKIAMLYGGQDIPQETPPSKNRAENPHLFCHKYGWVCSSLKAALESIKYCSIETRKIGSNILIKAYKGMLT